MVSNCTRIVSKPIGFVIETLEFLLHLILRRLQLQCTKSHADYRGEECGSLGWSQPRTRSMTRARAWLVSFSSVLFKEVLIFDAKSLFSVVDEGGKSRATTYVRLVI